MQVVYLEGSIGGKWERTRGKVSRGGVNDQPSPLLASGAQTSHSLRLGPTKG